MASLKPQYPNDDHERDLIEEVKKYTAQCRKVKAAIKYGGLGMAMEEKQARNSLNSAKYKLNRYRADRRKIEDEALANQPPAPKPEPLPADPTYGSW